jgi:hypothetical protein
MRFALFPGQNKQLKFHLRFAKLYSATFINKFAFALSVLLPVQSNVSEEPAASFFGV